MLTYTKRQSGGRGEFSLVGYNLKQYIEISMTGRQATVFVLIPSINVVLCCFPFLTVQTVLTSSLQQQNRGSAIINSHIAVPKAAVLRSCCSKKETIAAICYQLHADPTV